MPISFLTNTGAMTVGRYLTQTTEAYQKAAERVASGRRINRSLDDAAGLAISSRLEVRIRSTQQAQRTAMDALSLIQVAEGGMTEISNILSRLRELSIQAGSDNLSDDERGLLNFEAEQLIKEIDRLAESTTYSGNKLLNGSGEELNFQIGVENTENDRITYDASSVDVRSSTLGVDAIELNDRDSALEGLEVIDNAITKAQGSRAQLGAIQARIHPIVNNLRNYEENLTAANSRIRDADLATESTELVRTQVQQKATVAILAQANFAPALALKLIEGI